MKTKQYFWKMTILAAAAAAVLLTGCAQQPNSAAHTAMNSAMQSMTAQEDTSAGYLTLSVNPEIRIAYDENGLVTKLTGKNDEGQKIVTAYEGYAGQPCGAVVSALIERIYDAGYFVEDIDGRERNIVIQLEAGSDQPTVDFLTTIRTDAQTTVDKMSLTSGVVDIGSDDYDAKYATTSTPSPYITLEKAKEIALTQAGVKASDATFYDREFDFDDGYALYELEFTASGVKYEYDVDAKTGKILSAEHENYDTRQTQSASGSSAAQNSGSKQNTASSSGSYIGESRAKEIAYSHAGVKAANVILEKCRLDWDDGRAVYEVDFYAGDMEYDYEIDASTGTVYEADRDRMDAEDRYKADLLSGKNTSGSSNAGSTSTSGNTGSSNTGSTSTGSQTSSASYIGVEKAKSIALNHAGASASAVFMEKCELDRDDGRMLYEVEFRSGYLEYEYEIDAVSGSILKAEQDYDD